MKTLFLSVSTALIITACSAAQDTAKETGEATKEAAAKVTDFVADKLPEKFEGADAGTYSVDKGHAFLTASVSHGGLSDYRMDFTEFDASLIFDPNDASATSIKFTVNPASVTTHYPGDYKAGHADTGFETWDEHISRHAKLFNTDQFPKASFSSENVRRTGPYAAKVKGNLTFLGVSKPVTFDVTYNGVGNKPWLGERDLIGFNANTTIDRSDWGLTTYKGGIGDEVTISFSGEFLQNE